ncbi:MAG TPA: septal ring lytic transglycosylase RlpA family protein [Candidatus Binatia bacterium]|jgi:rare lipoprotein A
MIKKSFSSGNVYYLIFLFAAGCSLPVTKASIPPEKTPPARLSQTGMASWYGPGFHGRISASGSAYDQHGFTAAHQTLPLGTHVLVTHLSNGKSAEVTITDRGPFAKGRILDVSYAAAQALGMIEVGTARVRLEVLDGPVKIQKIRDRLDYTLQIGSFADLDNATKLKEQLGKSFAEPSQITIVPFRNNEGTYYRVQAGIFSSRSDAEAQAKQFTGQGLPVVIMEK